MEDQRPLPTIPIPPAQRWREVRLLYLPRIVFVLGVIGAGLLWTRWVTPSGLIAEAEAPWAEVRCAHAGVLVDLKVTPFQAVKAGDVIGHVATVDPKFLEATVAVTRAEAGLLSATGAGATERQRVALDFERLRLEWMQARVELADLRGRLKNAEMNLARLTPLHQQGVVTNEEYDMAKTERDSLVERVREQARLVTQTEPALRALALREDQVASLSSDSAEAAARQVHEAEAEVAQQEYKPITLTAPINGVVALVLRRPGETVVTGEPIVRISAPRPEKLTGFLRQPLTFQPQVGMPVEVRTRSHLRQTATSQIVSVGPAMEIITPSLVSAMRLPPTPLPEPGLRVEIALPSGLELRPGEFVDIVVP